MKLHPASPEDGERLSRLHDANFADRWDAAFFTEMLSQSGGIGLIATDEAGDAGFILIRAVAGEAEILTIAVSRRARRQGLGRALVQAAAAKAHAENADMMFLEVAVSNHPARALYENLGFKKAGLRKRYYQIRKNGMEDAEDALVLRASLPLGNDPL